MKQLKLEIHSLKGKKMLHSRTTKIVVYLSKPPFSCDNKKHSIVTNTLSNKTRKYFVNAMSGKMISINNKSA